MSEREALGRALASLDSEERRRAVSDLGREDPEQITDLMLLALGDADWRVRKEAIRVAIAASPAPALLAALVATLLPGDNVGLRNAAVEAIAGHGADAVDAIAMAMSEFDADGRKLAVEALAQTGQPAALLVLRPLLKDIDLNVRAAALEGVTAIGAKGVEEAGPILIGCLEDPEPLFRLTAFDGLNRLGMPLPWERIEELAKDPILERAALAAAGRAGDERASEVLVAALGRLRGTSLREALHAIVELARQRPETLARLRLAAGKLPQGARTRVLDWATQAEDVSTRARALSAAGVLGFEEVAGSAVRALSDERLLVAADEALDFLGPAAVPALIEYCREGEPDARAAGFELLARLVDATTQSVALDEMLRALSDDSPEVVRAALGALAVVGDASCFPSVAQCLAPERPVLVRKAAENSIAALALAFPDDARRLARTVSATGPLAQTATTIMSSLPAPVHGSIGDDVQFLSRALSNGPAPVRRSAIEALATLGSPEGVDAVAFALTDEESEVRVAAVRALGRLRAPSGEVAGLSHLLALVERPADSEMFTVALEALGEAGDVHALSILKPVARSGEPVAAVAAIEAIARFSGQRRTEALIEGLSHSETEVVKAAMRALAESEDPRVLVHLGACLDHEAWDIRRLAADLLSQVGETASGLLRARLNAEDNPLVKDAITRGLEQMAGLRRTPPPPRGSLRPR